MYAVFMFLLSCLFQLRYDDSRRVGEVAIALLDRWRHKAVETYHLQNVKLDKMKRARVGPSTGVDEIAEQEDLVERIKATHNWLESAENELLSWGYRRQLPVPPPGPALAGPSSPEKK
jgi:hypothetical protein